VSRTTQWRHYRSSPRPNHRASPGNTFRVQLARRAGRIREYRLGGDPASIRPQRHICVLNIPRQRCMPSFEPAPRTGTRAWALSWQLRAQTPLADDRIGTLLLLGPRALGEVAPRPCV
jgi:hypothetical protein